MSAPRLVTGEIIDSGEVITLRLLRMDGECVGDMHRRGDVCVGIGRDHPSEQRRYEAGGQGRGFAHRPDICAKPRPPPLPGIGGGFRVAFGPFGQAFGLL